MRLGTLALLVGGGWLLWKISSGPSYRAEVYDAGGGRWQYAIYLGDEIVWQRPDEIFGSEVSARAAALATIGILKAQA